MRRSDENPLITGTFCSEAGAVRDMDASCDRPGSTTRMRTVKELQVNGARHAAAADPDRRLLSVLRNDLGLTGAKYGCGEGQCGACTVLVDGHRVRSCVTRVSAAEGKPVRTVEGLAHGDKLHPLQEAFLEAGAMQCSYCTCGM